MARLLVNADIRPRDGASGFMKQREQVVFHSWQGRCPSFTVFLRGPGDHRTRGVKEQQ